MGEATLKPCPFCGKDKAKIQNKPSRRTRPLWPWRVRCEACGVRTSWARPLTSWLHGGTAAPSPRRTTA